MCHVLWPVSNFSQVVINEVQWSNQGHTFPDIDGTPDWVELINLGDSRINLSGFGLTDNPRDPYKFRFSDFFMDSGDIRLVYLTGNESAQVSGDPIKDERDLAGNLFVFSAESLDPQSSQGIRKSEDRWYLKNWNDQFGRNKIKLQATGPSMTNDPEIMWGSSPSESGVRFDGIDDQLRLSGIPQRLDGFSFTFIIRGEKEHEIESMGQSGVGGVSGQNYLFWPEHGGLANAGAGVSAGSNGISVYEHGANYMPAVVTYTKTDSHPYTLVTLTYHHGVARIYINGILRAESLPSPRSQILPPSLVGMGSYGAYTGILKYLSGWDRALEPQEVSALHHNLASRFSIELFTPVEAPFKLSDGNEPVVLTSAEGQRLDMVLPIKLPRNTSYGRARESGQRGIMDSPTPGNSNASDIFHGWTESPEISHPSGFYRSSFDLELKSSEPGVRYHFSLDGTIPDENDPLSDGIISINSSSRKQRKLMDIPTSGGWKKPLSAGPRAVVLTVRAFKEGFLPSPVQRRTFFLHNKGHQLFDLPVFSVFIQEEDFFDDEIGIYVQGNSELGNYWNRGQDWERTAFVEFFDKAQSAAFAQPMGVRVFGGTSRQFPQKSLRFYTTRNNDNAPLRYQLFPESERNEFDRFILRQSGHDHHFTFIRDAFMTRIGEEAGVETQDYRPAHLFLNGEYWGIHNLRESFDAGYFTSHHHVEKADLNLVEGFFRADYGTSVPLVKLYKQIDNPGLSQSDKFRILESEIDIENFLTYKALETFFYRWDTGNLKRWRPEKGKWRWLWFDSDVGSGGFASVAPAWEFPMLDYNLEPAGPWNRYPLNNHNNPTMTKVFRAVMDNDDWNEDFIIRYCDLVNSILTPQYLTEKIDELAGGIESSMPWHIRRWGNPPTLTTWHNELNHLKNFATNRQSPSLNHIKEKFNLKPPHHIELGEWNPNHGRVSINSIPPEMISPGFRGTYFSEFPVSIMAESHPGYQFTGWEEIPGNSSSHIQLLLRADTRLTPVFSKITVPEILVKALVKMNVDGSHILVLIPEFIPMSSGNETTLVLETSDNLVSWEEHSLHPAGTRILEIPFTGPVSDHQFFRITPQN